MRLPDVAGALDFNEKIILRKRLDELAAAHVNTLILSEAQTENVLGVAGQAGLGAMVEIAIDAHELTAPKQARTTIARVGKAMKLLRGYPALMGILIDCPIHAETISRIALSALRSSLDVIVRDARESNDRLLVTFKRYAGAPHVSIAGEDFSYFHAASIDEAAIESSIRAMHDCAGAKPLVIEFGEGFPGQADVVALAFGLGAAGVVATAMRPAAPPGWQNVRMLSAGELLPFTHLGGTAVPLPAVTPMISVVVTALDDGGTLAACLKSIERLRYPNFEVIVIDEGTGDRTGEVATIDLSADHSFDTPSFLGKGPGVRFPGVRLIRGKVGGLPNEALRAARGDLIAFTRADCIVDADWLSLAVHKVGERGFDGCCGPIYQAQEELGFTSRVAAALELSGARTDRIDDAQIDIRIMRNLVVRKSSLIAAVGTSARSIKGRGDRDLPALMVVGGLKLGWCPAGLVWRGGRPTIGEFFRNRIAQGHSEAILALDHASRFGGSERPHRGATAESRRDDHNHAGLLASVAASALSSMGGIARTVARHHYLAKAVGGAASVNAACGDVSRSAHHLAIGHAHSHAAHPVSR